MARRALPFAEYFGAGRPGSVSGGAAGRRGLRPVCVGGTSLPGWGLLGPVPVWALLGPAPRGGRPPARRPDPSGTAPVRTLYRSRHKLPCSEHLYKHAPTTHLP